MLWCLPRTLINWTWMPFSMIFCHNMSTTMALSLRSPSLCFHQLLPIFTPLTTSVVLMECEQNVSTQSLPGGMATAAMTVSSLKWGPSAPLILLSFVALVLPVFVGSSALPIVTSNICAHSFKTSHMLVISQTMTLACGLLGSTAILVHELYH